MSRAHEHMADVLTALGFEGDPEMGDTPRRFTEMLAGFRPGEPPELSVFEVDSGGPVVLRELPFYSLCAHHLLPFFGHAAVAYVPDGRVAGLGGLARLLDYHARQPQLQERLAEQLAEAIEAALQPRGLVVHLEARQMCMEMRGARSTGQVEVTATRGDAAAALAALVRRA